MAKRAGTCLYLFGSMEILGQVRLDLSELTAMRLPLGKLPRMIGVINPLRGNNLTKPLIEWEETTLVIRTYECPTVSSILELVKVQKADIVVIHQPQGYNLDLLRQTIITLLKEGTHVLLSGKATKRLLLALPVDIPIIACENCEFPDDDGNACQRNALDRVQILRNLSKEFILEILESCLEFSRKFKILSAITSLTRMKEVAESMDWFLPDIISYTLEKITGFKTKVAENRYLCRRHKPSEMRMGKLIAVFGTSGALNQPIIGSGKSEYLAKLARAYGTSVFTGLARESRAKIRDVQFIWVDGFDDIKTEGDIILIDEFHTIRGDWRNFLEQALKLGKTVVVALPFSDADGVTSERAAGITLSADAIEVHEAACWQCQSPAFRLTCQKMEANGERHNLSSTEIATLRAEHVRINPNLKWDAVCLNHHPLTISEPSIFTDEARERDDFRKLCLQRRFSNFKRAALTIIKWGVFLVLGVIVWQYWSTLQPVIAKTLDLAVVALQAVSENILTSVFFYVKLPLLVRRPLETTLLAYVVLRFMVEFWSDDRVSRRNNIPGFAIWTIAVPPICGFLYFVLGTFFLLIVLIGSVGFLFNLLSKTTSEIYGFMPTRRKKLGR